VKGTRTSPSVCSGGCEAKCEKGSGGELHGVILLCAVFGDLEYK